MNNKNIIFIIALYLNNILFGMEIEPHDKLNLKSLRETMPGDAIKEITRHAGPPQWWYLDKTFHNEEWINSDYAHLFNNRLALEWSDHSIKVSDIKTKTAMASFPISSTIASCQLDASEKFITVALSDHTTHIFDIEKQTKIYSLQHNSHIGDACYNSSENLLAIISDKTAHIFNTKTQTKITSLHNDNYIFLPLFDRSGKLFSIISGNIARIFNTATYQEIFFVHDKPIFSFCFDYSGKLFAIVSNDYKRQTNSHDCNVYRLNDYRIHIFNIETQKEIASFSHPSHIYLMSFDSSGKLFVIQSNKEEIISDKQESIITTCLFARHDDYTIEQLQLKKTLLTWLLIEKPNKQITTLGHFLSNIALKCAIPYQTLIEIWTTFPEGMQNAIWRTMQYKIQKYGKM